MNLVSENIVVCERLREVKYRLVTGVAAGSQVCLLFYICLEQPRPGQAPDLQILFLGVICRSYILQNYYDNRKENIFHVNTL